MKPDDYAAVYIGGGYGTLFDVGSNPKILSIIAAIYESGGIIGGCGYGPVAFANVKLSNGEFMVKGIKIAGFPDPAEKSKSWAKEGSLLPYLVEDQLRKNGALVGGFGRLLSIIVVGIPSLPVLIFTVIEVPGVPLLIYWQYRVVKSYTTHRGLDCARCLTSHCRESAESRAFSADHGILERD